MPAIDANPGKPAAWGVFSAGHPDGMRPRLPRSFRPEMSKAMAIPIPGDVRQLLDAPNYVHLSTLRADGSPRNWVVWVGLEDDYILVCTSDAIWKAKDMRRDPRVAMSVTDMADPYRMAAIQGRVVDVRRDEGCRYMDPISVKYTGAPFPSRGQDRVCFVIAVDKAACRALGFVHDPGNAAPQRHPQQSGRHGHATSLWPRPIGTRSRPADWSRSQPSAAPVFFFLITTNRTIMVMPRRHGICLKHYFAHGCGH